jgi:ribosomal protein uS13
MARLVGVDLPREKRVEIALTYIFGVGRTRANKALAETGINPDTRVRDLGDEELVKLRDYLEGNFKIEGDLRREVAADIRRKVEIARDRQLPGHPSPSRPSGARSADQDQCANSQGTQAHGGRQEEGRQVVQT